MESQNHFTLSTSLVAMSDVGDAKQKALALYQKRVREHREAEAKVRTCTLREKSQIVFQFTFPSSLALFSLNSISYTFLRIHSN